jgi:DNA repair protein SbcC/Rad50
MFPRKLIVKNFLTYAEETFDFNKYEGLTLITGINSENGSNKESNGSGKSSIFDAISWCLFGRVRNVFDKTLLKDDIIRILDDQNTRADECKVEYEFEINDQHYKVIRTRKLKGNTTLEIYNKINDEWQSLTLKANINKETDKKESAMIKTEKQIENILNCSCDLFINSVLFEQGNTNTFAISSKSDKQNLFTDVLSLVKWYDYARLAKDKAKIVKQEILSSETILNQYPTIEELNEKQENLQINLRNNTILETQLKTDLKLISKEIEKLTQDLSQFTANIKQLSKLEIELETKNTILSEHTTTISNLKNEQTKAETEHNKLIESQKTISTDIVLIKSSIETDLLKIVKIDSKEEETITSNINRYNIELATLSTKIEFLNQKKLDVKVIECPVPNCPNNSEEKIALKLKTINTDIFNLNIKKSKIDKDLKCLTDKLIDIKDIIATNNLIIKENEKNKTRKSELELQLYEINLKIQKKYDSLQSIKKELSGLELTCKDLETIILNLKDEIAILKKSTFNFEAMNHKLEISKDQFKHITSQLENLIVERTNINNKQIRNKEDIEKIKEYISLLESLNNKNDYIKQSIDILGKEIPHHLIETAIPEIEHYANDFLNRLSKGRMSLTFITEKELQSKDSDGKQLLSDTFDLELSIDGRTYKYGLFSGGERSRADIAIHLAMSVFLISRGGMKLETLFLDEISASLDSEGSDTLIEILQELLTTYHFKKIFIISQDDKMKNKIDSVMTIIKTDNGSKIL